MSELNRFARIFGLVSACLALLASGCRSEGSAEAQRVIEQVRKHVASSDDAEFPAPLRIEAQGDILRAVFEPAAVAHQAEVDLPANSAAPVRITDPASGLAIELMLQRARAATAETISGAVAYAGGSETGDVLYRIRPSSLEGFVSFEQQPRESRLVYEVSFNEAVSELRLEGTALAFVDSRGITRLRWTLPLVRDATSRQQSTRFDLAGCNVELSSAAAASARNCQIQITWEDAELTYPLMLNPEWSVTGSPKVLIVGEESRTEPLAAALQPIGVDLTTAQRLGMDALLESDSVVLLKDISELTPELQTALANFVRRGGGLVHWTSKASLGGALDPLLLLRPTGTVAKPGALSKVEAMQFHPVISDWKDGARVESAFEAARVRDFLDGSTAVLVRDAEENDVVAVRSLKRGHVMQLNQPLPDFDDEEASSSIIGILKSGVVWSWLPDALYVAAPAPMSLTSWTCATDAGCPECGYCSAGRCWPRSRGYWNGGCFPYLCDGVQVTCPVDCAGGCANGLYCWNLACKWGSWAGRQCDTDSNCSGTRCAFNYCCSGTCGPCGRCSGTGACEPLVAGTPVAACGAYRCNGTSTNCPSSCSSQRNCSDNAYCTTAGCRWQQGLGTSCVSNLECESGYCVDGVCCDSSCGGTCQACSVSAGASVNGQCTVPVGRALPECSPYVCSSSATCLTSCSSDAGCATGYYCNPSQRCAVRQANGTSCTAANQCQSGVCNAGFCCGTSNSCSPYVCGSSGACLNSCTTSSQCASGLLCISGTCMAPQANGAACTIAAQCLSGNCVDGFCCDTACGDQCDSCAASKGATVNGTCTVVSATSPGESSCAPYLCSGTSSACGTSCQSDANCAASAYCNDSGQCVADKAVGSACTRSEECPGGNCVDGFCCNSSCSGACNVCSKSLGATADGTCTNAAGFAGDPACAPYLCSASSVSCPSTCTTDAQCSSGNYCGSGQCVPKRANGAACTTSNVCASGNCVDGFCCDSDCFGKCDTCAASKGATANGTCTILPATSLGESSCSPYLCSGTSNACGTSCQSDANCAASAYCNDAGQCVADKAVGDACTRSEQCTGGNCVDGFCCNSACGGSCDVCSKALGGTANGTCSNAAGYAGDPACAPYLCSASSASCPSTCTTDAQCSSGNYCNNGQCVPKRANGVLCSIGNDCASGNCVDGLCCDSACDGACDTCAASKGASADGTCTVNDTFSPGDPSCTPYFCSGTTNECSDACSSDAQCVGTHFCDSTGKCKPRKANGVSCAQANECQSFLCVDDVCCNSACGGACDACSVAKGATSNGTCTNVVNAPGDPSCAPYLCSADSAACPTSCATDAQCVEGNFCDANKQCAPKRDNGGVCTAANQCVSGQCVDGFCCDSACSGGCDTCAASKGAAANGTCSVVAKGRPGENPTCGAYLCSGESAACATTCTSNGDCVTGNFCNGSNRCVPLLANGSICGGNDQCESNFCVDGVCCNSACTDQCAACNLVPNVGTCSAATGAPKGGRPACATDGTSCGGACNGQNSTACTFPDTSVACGDPTCAEGAATTAPRCNGAGACLPGTASACDPYVCGADACLTQCATNADCQAGHFCSGQQCIPQRDLGERCELGTDCESGVCADGYCCDSACLGSCDRCDLTAREGLCTLLGAGTAPPSGECAPLLCDGSSASCPAACISNQGCQPGHLCLEGACVPAKARGSACEANAECGSGFCIDGVCCNTACEGSCATCVQPGSVGTCSLVIGAAAPGRSACGGTGLCGATCTGTQAECSFPGTETACSPGFCSDATVTAPSTCDGAGSCVPGAQAQCGLGCAGSECAKPVTKTAGGCASTESAALGLLIAVMALLGKGRGARVRG